MSAVLPSRFCVILLAISALSGCTPDTRRNYLRLPYQGRPEYAPPKLSLAEKEAFFHEMLEKEHVSAEGFLIYNRKAEIHGEEGLGYGTTGDLPIWGGIHLAAESFRFAVTRDPASLEIVRRSVRSLHTLQAVHGIPGLLARQYCPLKKLEASLPNYDRSRWHPAALPDSGLVWQDDVSKDQYAGLIFGYAVAYDLVPDEGVRSQIRQDLIAIADFLIKNDYRIIDHDGQPTTYGCLQARVGPVPIGVHALISLAAIKVAHHVSGEPRFEKEYQRLVRRRWPQATWMAKFQFLGKTNHNNDNMSFLSLYSLLRLETNPDIRRYYQRSADRTWKYVRDEGNAFWTFIYLGTGSQDSASLEDAKLQLRNFPLCKRRYAVDIRDRKDIQRSWFRNRYGAPKARYPLPINLRSQTDFSWKDCPYSLHSFPKHTGNWQHAPIDYLAAYWMGRYHQFIGSLE